MVSILSYDYKATDKALDDPFAVAGQSNSLTGIPAAAIHCAWLPSAAFAAKKQREVIVESGGVPPSFNDLRKARSQPASLLFAAAVLPLPNAKCSS